MHIRVLYVIIVVMHLSMCSYLYPCICVLVYLFWYLFTWCTSVGSNHLIWNKPYLTWASIDAAGCSWAAKVICLHSSESLIATAMVNWPWTNFVPLDCCVRMLFQDKQHTEAVLLVSLKDECQKRTELSWKRVRVSPPQSTLHTVHSSGNIWEWFIPEVELEKKRFKLIFDYQIKL